jgi:PAS domain S-box-containing protein
VERYGPNFRIQRSFFDRVWEQRDEKALYELFDGEASGIDPARVVNPDTYRPWRRGLLNLMEGIHIEFQDWLEQGDRLTMRGVLRGRSKRHGNSVVWPFAGFGRYRDGKIAEAANYLDHLSLFEQLGLVTEQAIENCLAGENLFQEVEEAARRAEERKQRPSQWLTRCGVVRPASRVFIFPGATAKRPARFLLPTDSQPQELALPDDEQLQVLFEAAVYGMAIVDDSNRVVESNMTLSEFTDLPLQQVLGTAFSDLLHPLDRRHEGELFEELRRESRATYSLDARLIRNGSVSFIRVAAARIPTGDRQLYIKAVQHRGHEALEELVRFQETERRLLSYDLHDGLAQDLATLWCQFQTPPDSLAESAALQQRALTLVRRMSHELRRKLHDLQNPVSQGIGLGIALQNLVDLFGREDALAVELLVADEVAELVGVPALFTYRVVQEALRNAVRHGRASVARVQLCAPAGLLRGEVRDEGCGFVLGGRVSGGYGIAGMRERCALLGGELEIDSSSGAGTTVRFSFPLR